jgi:hypothetical protein
MYISDKLLDQRLLSYRAIQDETLRQAYIQGAINDMLEKWQDLIDDQQLKQQFYIKKVSQNK